MYAEDSNYEARLSRFFGPIKRKNRKKEKELTEQPILFGIYLKFLGIVMAHTKLIMLDYQYYWTRFA